MQPNQPPAVTSPPPKLIDQVTPKKVTPATVPANSKPAEVKKAPETSNNMGVGLVIGVAIVMIIVLIGLAYYAYSKSPH